MPNKNYNSGRNFEYRVKKYLEQKGYYVMRSAGSKSLFDLMAIAKNYDINILLSVLLIQCKHGNKTSKQEREKIKEFECSISSSETTCVVAWAKANKPIEFYWWAYGVDYEGKRWQKMDGL